MSAIQQAIVSFSSGSAPSFPFSTTYTTPGTSTVSIPVGATQAIVEVIGAGAGAFWNTGTVRSGGGGGGYAQKTYPVGSLSALYLSVPATTAYAAAGSPSFVKENNSGGTTIVNANGGGVGDAIAGGNGGAGTVGFITFTGGGGSLGSSNASTGGGSAASQAGAGTNAVGAVGGTSPGAPGGNGGSAGIGSDYGGGSGNSSAASTIAGTQGWIKVTWSNPTYATWNPADKTGGVILGGGSLQAIFSSSPSQARTTIGKTSGKWYWEVTLGTGFTGGLGTTNASGVLTTDASNDVNAFQYFHSNGTVYNQGTGVAAGATYTVGDVIGFALDCTSQTCQVFKNNVAQFTLVNSTMPAPKTVFTGTMYPYFTLYSGQLTANFGATALTYAPPAGFNAGLYV